VLSFFYGRKLVADFRKDARHSRDADAHFHLQRQYLKAGRWRQPGRQNAAVHRQMPPAGRAKPTAPTTRSIHFFQGQVQGRKIREIELALQVIGWIVVNDMGQVCQVQMALTILSHDLFQRFEEAKRFYLRSYIHFWMGSWPLTAWLY